MTHATRIGIVARALPTVPAVPVAARQSFAVTALGQVVRIEVREAP